MIKRVLGIIFLIVATAAVAAAQSAPTQSPAPTKPATPPPAPHTNLKVGDPAPDFNLPSTIVDANSKTVRYKLSDFKGKKNVVLAFYVLAFTGGWTKELQGYQADIAKLEGTDTQVLGISMDSNPANKEYAQKIGVTFPLLSDWKREVVKAYGIYDPAKSDYAMRTTFVIDKDGIIQHIKEGNEAVDPTSAIDACNLLTHKKATQ